MLNVQTSTELNACRPKHRAACRRLAQLSECCTLKTSSVKKTNLPLSSSDQKLRDNPLSNLVDWVLQL